MHVALLSCRDLPDWEVDDRPLHAALRARGVQISTPAWDATDWTADAVLLRTPWDYTERRDAFVARVEGMRVPVFNEARVVRWNTDKRYLRDLEEDGIGIAPTTWIEPGEAFDAAGFAGDRGFLKPVVGATARETLRFARDEAGLAAAAAHVARLGAAGERMMLQPYLASVEDEGERSLIVIDGRVTHGVRKVPVPGDYRVQDDFGAHDEPWEPDPAALALGEAAMAAAARRLGGTSLLYGRVDLLRDDAGRWVLNELELVEPSLFFRHGPHAAERLADALLARL